MNEANTGKWEETRIDRETKVIADAARVHTPTST
jgi:hypothetical protein